MRREGDKEATVALTRREFILIGAATGATAASGVLVPVSVASRKFVSEDEASDTATVSDEPMALVRFFPKVKVAQLSTLREGEPVTFDYPLVGQRNILVKLGRPAAGGLGPEEDIVAFSSICTHMGCPLEEYRHDQKVLGPCPCHFSTFDLAHGGMVTLGQATQNLPQVLLTTDGDDIFAEGVVRLVYGFDNTLEGAELIEETA
ncbi:MAG: arsenate reductase (azurin) small subunit [Acidimicrobiia bacterium]